MSRQHISASFLPRILCIMILFALLPPEAQGSSCKYPLFIQRSVPEANVLIIFDNSGSMNEAMYHDDYNPNIAYSGGFYTNRMYYVSRSGWYSPRDFSRRLPRTPTAYLVQSDNGRRGRYIGNYLNWIYYHATDQQRAEIPRVTRIQVAKACVADLISNTDEVSFGLMKFDYNDGGILVAEIGTDKTELLSRLYDIEGDSWTPLAETMVSALDYLSEDGANAPIKYWCQHTFIIVITDGFPTMDLDVPGYIGDYDHDRNDPGDCQSIGAPYSNSNDCSDYMDDVALYLFMNDLLPNLKNKQNVETYTIGFNIDAGILQETADNGRGMYFSVSDAAELRSALSDAIRDIIAKKSSGTSVAVVSTETSTGNRVYRAKFKPGQWRGYLEAYNLPYKKGDQPIWKAAKLLQRRNPDTRKIYTTVDGMTGISFGLSNQSAIEPYLNTSSPDSASDIIRYIRGEHIPGYRARGNWKLGDIVNSSPVVVGPPGYFHEFLDYPSFREANSSREEVIYIGANDGMLHCFSAETGEEKWAYIPKNLLGKLKELTDKHYCHEFYVDMTPAVTDAYVNGGWRTILFGGEGEGGDGYFAIDVTDPNSMSLLWDITLPSAKKSWSAPEVVRDKTLDKFIAFLGSGPDRENGEARLIALDLADGSVLWSDLLSSSTGMNLATSPAKIDLDLDGYDDLLYVADINGHVWRYDLRSYPWIKTLLFETDQPIQAKPALSVDNHGNVLVFFGTGKYIDSEDITDTNSQSFYCVEDDNSAVTAYRSSLVDQTYSINPISATDRGWFIDLVQAPGERVTKACLIAARTVYFTSFKPNAETCKWGGSSWFYNVNYLKGHAPDNDDGSENETTENRVEDLGTGIYSEPVLDMANEDIIIQSSNTQMVTKDAKGLFQRIVVHGWRELYQ